VIVAIDVPAQSIVESEVGENLPAVLGEEVPRRNDFIQVVVAERLLLLGGWIERPPASGDVHLRDPGHQLCIEVFSVRQNGAAGVLQGRIEGRSQRVLGWETGCATERVVGISAGTVPIGIALSTSLR
jgi:hypothetical protein